MCNLNSKGGLTIKLLNLDLQSNLSTTDTDGTEQSVRIREVSVV